MARKTLCFLLFILSCKLAHSQDLIDNIDKYHQNSTWQKVTAIEFFNQFAEKTRLRGDETLLDVCSGDGKITAAMAQRLAKGQVVGVDISENMVKFAKDHYANHPSHLTFQQMNATALNFNNRFDVITSFTCMHLIPDQKLVLQGMYNSLKRDGKLLMVFPIVHGFSKALQETTSSLKWKSYFQNFKPNWHFFSPEEYQMYLQSVGFTPQRIQVLRQDETYPNIDLFADSISHWLPHLKVLPENLRSSFARDLVQAYLQSVPKDQKGQIHFYVDNMIIEAMRS